MEKKGRREGGKDRSSDWPGAATSDFPMETSQETLRKGGGRKREERKKRGLEGQKEGVKGREGKGKESEGGRKISIYNIDQR